MLREMKYHIHYEALWNRKVTPVLWSPREQVLKRRVSAVRESLDLVLSDSASRRRDNDEQMARLAQAHR